MEKDRIEICKIMSEMLDNPNDVGIYPTSDAYNALETYIESVRMKAIGWTHADACIHMDKDINYRKIEIPEILERAKIDLK